MTRPVRALIDADADVNVLEPRRGQSALMWAISFANPEAARVLIETGADISARTTKLNENYSPMEIEAYTKSVPGTAQGGYTSLMFAARQGDVASAKLLLHRGADVNAESAADGSPLVIATAAGHEDLADLYGAAIASRLRQFGPIVKLEGADRRAAPRLREAPAS